MRFNLISGAIIATLLVNIILIQQGIMKMDEDLNPEERFIVRTTMISQVHSSKLNKTAVMIVAYRNFRDPEYSVPKQILESAGIEVETASNQMGTAIGAEGGRISVDLLVSDIKPADFDTVIFIGGPGCLESLDNEDSYRVAKETVAQDKTLASICISPVILAKAGVLENKRATVWRSAASRDTVLILEENGAIYTPESVVIDGKIITADGPEAAKEFGEAIVKSLTSD